MKKRLFALLLATVMILSLAVTAFGEGQTVPERTETEAAEPAAGQSVQTAADTAAQVTEDTETTEGAEVTEDAEITEDVQVTEDAENTEGTEVTEDTETTGDAEVTEDAETGENDDGEPAPLAEGEAQAAAVTDVKVTLINNTGRELTFYRWDGTTFHSGETVPLNRGYGYLRISPASRDIGVTVENGTQRYDATTYGNGEFDFTDDNGDGEVTLTLYVRSSFQLFVKNGIEGVTCTITDPEGNKTLADGDLVYLLGENSAYVPLIAKLTEGYAFDAGSDYVRYIIGSSIPLNLYVQDDDHDGKVTLTVVKALQLHMGDAQVMYVSSDEIGRFRYEEGLALTEGQSFFVKVKGGLALEATNAEVKHADYYFRGYDLNDMTGEYDLLYEVTPDGSGDVTLKTVESTEEPPAMVELQYAGDTRAFFDVRVQRKFAWSGEFYSLYVQEGYGIELNGEPMPLRVDVIEGEPSYTVLVVAGSQSPMVFKGVQLETDPVLAVDGDASALVKDYDGESYALAGDTLSSGFGYVLVKNGYTIDEKATTGGTCMFLNEEFQTDGTIYRLYYVQPNAHTMTLKVVSTKPSRWVDLQLVNEFEDQVTLETYAGEEVEGEDGLYRLYVDPNEDIHAVVSLSPVEEGGSVKAFTVGAEGADVAPFGDSGHEYSVKVRDDVEKVIVRVSKLEAQAPGAPAAGTPGVTDKAETEEKLLDTAENVVESAVKGKTPAGVTEADAKAIAAAATAGQTITTQLVAEAVQSPSDAAAIEKAAGEDATVAQYVDAQIVVKADGETIGHITQTEEPIQLSVVLTPEQLDKGLIFFVVRSHEGQTDILPATVDGNVLTFSTDKFSTFGVAYTSDISYAAVSPIPDQKWTGKAITPKVTVTANGRTLTEGTDYEVSYEKNTDAGTAKVIITGKDPYTGTKEAAFQIVKAASGGTGSGQNTSPKTGDETPIALWAGILALSLAGLGLVLTRRKKSSR